MENKKKRYYKKGEIIWLIAEKKEAIFESFNKETLEATVTVHMEPTEGVDFYASGGNVLQKIPIWGIDKLKYNKAKELQHNTPTKKVTYFAPVKGGIIPTKSKENAGRDTYARLEPVKKEGKEVFELHIPRLTLAKIPLGFASYLDEEDFLSLKHERSSIGGTGLINVSGLIDSTYQGEVILQVVPLVADVVISSEVDEKYFDEKLNTYFIPYHKAIAQAVVIPQSQAEDLHISYDELLSKPSQRGTQGWGSSGK